MLLRGLGFEFPRLRPLVTQLPVAEDELHLAFPTCSTEWCDICPADMSWEADTIAGGHMANEVTIITPTHDRPAAFALCEKWMGRQIYGMDNVHWIVSDDGKNPVHTNMGQTHVYSGPRDPGPESLARNILDAIPLVDSELIIMVEDDDYYPADYIIDIVHKLEFSEICGSIWQRYYNLKTRQWKMMRNGANACLCQTGFRRNLLHKLAEACEAAMKEHSFHIDQQLWKRASHRNLFFVGSEVIGMKGLPGEKGLGAGHKPDRSWKSDPELVKLREWVGGDVKEYRDLFVPP
jgi:hypothetical protein